MKKLAMLALAVLVILLTADPELFVEFSGEKPHQVRLEGGDASSDSYCYS